jgi:hypothetical protein
MEAIFLLEAAKLHSDARVKESLARKFMLHPNDMLLSFPASAKTQM